MKHVLFQCSPEMNALVLNFMLCTFRAVNIRENIFFPTNRTPVG